MQSLRTARMTKMLRLGVEVASRHPILSTADLVVKSMSTDGDEADLTSAGSVLAALACRNSVPK